MRNRTAKLMPMGKNRILSVTIRHILDEDPDTSYMGEYSETRTSDFSIDRAHSEDCASVSPEVQKAKETLEHVQQTIGDMHNSILAQYNGTLANEKLDMERDALDEAYDVVGELFDSIDDCDCGERGDMQRNEYRYFNSSRNYVTKAGNPSDGLTAEEVRKYVRQDYERMERLHRGDWCYVGIEAVAKVSRAAYSGCPPEPVRIVMEEEEVSSGSVWGYESDSPGDLKQEDIEHLFMLKAELLSAGFSKRAISKAFEDVQEENK